MAEATKDNKLSADEIIPSSPIYDLANDGPGCVIIFDEASKKIIYCNKEFTDSFGYSEKEIYSNNRTIADLLPEHQLPILDRQIDTISKSDDMKNKYVIYNMKRADNTYLLHYGYASYHTAEHGKKYIYLLLFPELSKKPLPFISFDTREAFLDLFSKIGFGTYEWQIEQDQFFWSDGVYSIYEAEKTFEPITIEKIFSYVHPEDVEETKEIMYEAVRNCTSFELEKRIIINDKIKNLNVTGAVVCDSSGKPIKMTGCKREITEQRHIENELKKNVSQLHKSNQDLESFAYIASHDLQEPLRKISTFCSRLADKYAEALDSEGQMYISRVIASADNMRYLIDSLLDFSRITKDKQPFTSAKLSFILKQVLSELEIPIEENDAKIEIGTMPEIECHMVQMKQLFFNLIGNSIKFRKKDEAPYIQISSRTLSNQEKVLHAFPQNMKYYCITLKDSGIGFDNEYATKIFQIFHRLNGKSEYPGSGIGLAICKKIVDHHHGIIYAESSPGNGATFSIILPEKQVDNG